jgi:hypothetical protein
LTEICAFVGPTRLRSIPDGIDIFEPAALGSVFRAVKAGYRQICLIDGYFGNIPSVWHKEILFALKNGVGVCGSSSIGALRAAELHRYGMVGYGWVYRAFRRGVLQDDDEVCVLHAVADLNFDPLSEAMVNIRYTLRAMRRRGELGRPSERRIAAAIKKLHFAGRTPAAIRAAFDDEFGRRGAEKFDLFARAQIDIKALDAERMLSAVLSSPVGRQADGWDFPATNHWTLQFEVQQRDIPQISRWHPTYITAG